MKKNGKYLWYIIFAAAAIFMILCIAAALAPSRTISATGECVAKVPRDKFAVSLQIEVVRKDAAASIADVQSIADEVVQKIKIIADKTLEIQTKNINSYEKTEWVNNSSRIVGITSEIRLEVTTSNKDTLTEILGNINTAKDAHIFPQGFRNFSSPELVANETLRCLYTATENAGNKARAVADSDGRKLGNIISANVGRTNDSGDGGFVPVAMAKMSSGDFIQSSDGEIVVTVDATYEIK